MYFELSPILISAIPSADKKLATGDALAFCVGDLSKVQNYVGTVQVVLQATGRSVGHSAKNVDD